MAGVYVAKINVETGTESDAGHLVQHQIVNSVPSTHGYPNNFRLDFIVTNTELDHHEIIVGVRVPIQQRYNVGPFQFLVGVLFERPRARTLASPSSRESPLASRPA